jgi:hypothetical protein
VKTPRPRERVQGRTEDEGREGHVESRESRGLTRLRRVRLLTCEVGRYRGEDTFSSRDGVRGGNRPNIGRVLVLEAARFQDLARSTRANLLRVPIQVCDQLLVDLFGALTEPVPLQLRRSPFNPLGSFGHLLGTATA